MSLLEQFGWLALLAIPVACVAWTVTHEEIFREPREYCVRQSKRARRWYVRKLFYVPTCEYCFSHYVAVAAVLGSGFHLLLPDWRGTILAIFGVVWIANVYMSVFVRLRLEIKIDRTEAELLEQQEVESLPDGSKAARGGKVRPLQVPRRGINQ